MGFQLFFNKLSHFLRNISYSVKTLFDGSENFETNYMKLNRLLKYLYSQNIQNIYHNNTKIIFLHLGIYQQIEGLNPYRPIVVTSEICSNPSSLSDWESERKVKQIDWKKNPHLTFSIVNWYRSLTTLLD